MPKHAKLALAHPKHIAILRRDTQSNTNSSLTVVTPRSENEIEVNNSYVLNF